MERYNFKIVEEKWQVFWQKEKSFKTDINKNKEKFYSRIQSFRIKNDKNLKNLKINQIEKKINNNEEFDLFLKR